MIKNIITLVSFLMLFFIGILLILTNDYLSFASTESINLAGAIISVFSGSGFLMTYYFYKKNNN